MDTLHKGDNDDDDDDYDDILLALKWYEKKHLKYWVFCSTSTILMNNQQCVSTV